MTKRKTRTPTLWSKWDERPDPDDEDWLAVQRDWRSYWRLDFTQLVPGVATGGIVHDKEAVEELKRRGVTHVVNCAIDIPTEHLVLEDSGIEYLWNGENDDGVWKEPEWFARTIAFAIPAIKAGGNVYIHCWSGHNRGPSNAYAVMRVLGYSPKETANLITSLRPVARMAYRSDAEDAVTHLMETSNEDQAHRSAGGRRAPTHFHGHRPRPLRDHDQRADRLHGGVVGGRRVRRLLRRAPTGDRGGR